MDLLIEVLSFETLARPARVEHEARACHQFATTTTINVVVVGEAVAAPSIVTDCVIFQ